MNQKVVLFLSVCASLSVAAPQAYETLGVLTPEAGDLGSYGDLVSATLDILPEINEVFERVANYRSNDPQSVQQVILEFMPITRKVMQATGNAGGRSFTEDEYQRFNAAEAVMPSVSTFMNRLRDMDFFGVGTDPNSGSAVYA